MCEMCDLASREIIDDDYDDPYYHDDPYYDEPRYNQDEESFA